MTTIISYIGMFIELSLNWQKIYNVCLLKNFESIVTVIYIITLIIFAAKTFLSLFKS